MKKKEEKRGQKAKKEKQGAIRSLSGKIERTAEPPVGQEEKKDTGGQMEQLHPRLQEVLKAIESVQNAKREFGKLLAAGCDRTDLLATLFNSFWRQP